MNTLYDSRIKFYADTDKGEINKYFVFKVRSIFEVDIALLRFISKGFVIRACWYEKLLAGTDEVIENVRIDMKDFLAKHQLHTN